MKKLKCFNEVSVLKSFLIFSTPVSVMSLDLSQWGQLFYSINNLRWKVKIKSL